MGRADAEALPSAAFGMFLSVVSIPTLAYEATCMRKLEDPFSKAG